MGVRLAFLYVADLVGKMGLRFFGTALSKVSGGIRDSERSSTLREMEPSEDLSFG